MKIAATIRLHLSTHTTYVMRAVIGLNVAKELPVSEKISGMQDEELSYPSPRTAPSDPSWAERRTISPDERNIVLDGLRKALKSRDITLEQFNTYRQAYEAGLKEKPSQED